MDIEEMYRDCVESCQRMGSILAELEDLLFDEDGLDGVELADCVRELLEIKWMYDGLCK